MTEISNSSIRTEDDKTYPPLSKKDEKQDNINKNVKAPISKSINQQVNKNDVIIPVQQRRFKENDSAYAKRIYKSTSDDFNVKLKFIPSKLGNIIINVCAIDERSNIEKARFYLKESLFNQKSIKIDLINEHVNHFMDRRVQEKLCHNRYLFLRVDNIKKQIILDGGQESVDGARKEIEEYIAWNKDADTINLDIPSVYHPFIKYNENPTLKSIIEQSGNYVDVKFVSTLKGKIVIFGKKSCVEQAKERITKLFEHFRSTLIYKTSIVAEVQRLNIEKIVSDDLFNREGVMVTMEPLEDESMDYKLDVCGEEKNVASILEKIDKIQREFTVVRISTPYWICTILKTSSDMNNMLVKAYPKATFNVDCYKERVEIVCDESIINDVSRRLTKCIDILSINNTYTTIFIQDEFIKAMETKNFAKLEEVQIVTKTIIYVEKKIGMVSFIKQNIPAGCALCIIIGQAQQVNEAKAEIESYISFLSNFKTLKIKVPQHLHKYMIGYKGNLLKDIINKNGPNSTVSLGKHSMNKDECAIRGPESEVTQLSKIIKEKTIELGNIYYQSTVKISSVLVEFLRRNHSYLNYIKKTSNITSIQFIDDDKHTEIELNGRREDVSKAEKLIIEKTNEVSKMVTKDLNIPEKLVSIFENFGDAILKAIKDDVGNDLQITLPKQINPKSSLSLFGPDEKVRDAISIVKKLGVGEFGNYFYDKLKVCKEYLENFKNSNGEPLFKIIGNSKVRVYLPSTPNNESSSDSGTVLILGKKEDVLKVKDSMINELKILENTIEKVVRIKYNYKRDFLKLNNGVSIVQRISKTNNNVKIYIEDKVVDDKVEVWIKGSKENVENAILDIENSIKKIENSIEKTIQYDFNFLSQITKRHRTILKDYKDLYDVDILISSNFYDLIKSKTHDSSEMCTISIKGEPNNVDNALKIIKEWQVITKSYPYSCKGQKYWFNYDSEVVEKLRYDYFIEVEYGYSKTPPEDFIYLHGLKEDVEKGFEYFSQVASEHYEHKILINPEYFVRLIGKGGNNIKKFNAENKVTVFFPSDKQSSEVMICGKKENCLAAGELLTNITNTLKDTIIKTVEFDKNIKSALIKQFGVDFKNLQNEFKVSVRLSNKNVTENETLINDVRVLKISGLQNDVDKCVKHVEEIIKSIIEDSQDVYFNTNGKYDFVVDLSSISTKKIKNANKKNSKPISATQSESKQNNVNGDKIDSNIQNIQNLNEVEKV